MADIPKHLLERSKAAKAKATGAPAPTSEGTDSPSASTEVAATDSAAAVAAAAANFPNLDPEPEPAKPEASYVQAAKARPKIPVWALPVVPATLVWAWGFAATMQEPPLEDPVYIESAALYTSSGCGGCHGGTGGGGTGYKFTDGEILATFPAPIDHMVHVARGSGPIADQEYGAERPDGRRVSGARGKGQMPAQEEQLSQLELELIVFHERAVLSGEDVSSPEYEEWLEHMREAYESGDESEIDLAFLLDCADPAITPGATGAGSDDEDKPCPGPAPSEPEEDEN